MSNILKGAKTVDKAVTLDGPKASSALKKKKKTAAQNADSLNFSKTVTTEIKNLSRSLSEYLTQQAEERKKELEAVYREANEKGYQVGFDDAVKKERSERIAVIDELLKEARKKSENAIRGLELKVIDLAVNLAEQIIRKSIAEHPEIIESIIQETMAYLIGSERVILKVSADDFKTINTNYDRWLSRAGSAREFRIEMDRRLKPGDCIIETEGGIIDSMVENRLETIADELVKVIS